MDDLLSLILAPLEAGRAALCQDIRRHFEECRCDLEDYGDELHTLKEALQDYPNEYPEGWWMDASRCRWWLFLHADWKASDEIEWQCQAIVRTLGLEGQFFCSVPARSVQVLEVLTGAAPWFRRRGYELVGLEAGGDEYLAIPVRLDGLKQAFGVLDRLGIHSYLF